MRQRIKLRGHLDMRQRARRRDSPKVLAKWGACLTGEVLAKPGSCLGCCSVLGGWVNGCRWRHVMRSRRSTPGVQTRFEEGQGPDARRVRRGHGLVAGQCPAGDRGGSETQGPCPVSAAQTMGAHAWV